MKNIYCTYFNSGYLDRAIVLLRSMACFDPGSRIEVLCFDDDAADFFDKHSFPGVEICRLIDFERRNPELVSVKPTRSKAEYFFTCTSVWTADVARRNRDADLITYLDCDMRFYSSPASVFKLMEGRDILICPHYFSRDADKVIKYGKYNVGWLTFRTSETGMDCLEKWRSDCLDWCYERLEPMRYADQKYLDYWPEKYREHLIEAPITLDLGPWGIAPRTLTVENGKLCIKGEPIILYHFQGLRLYNDCHFYAGHCFHQSIVQILKNLYEPYIRELLSVRREFKLDSMYGNARRSNGGFMKRLATGYWIGHPYLSELIRWVQRLVK